MHKFTRIQKICLLVVVLAAAASSGWYYHSHRQAAELVLYGNADIRQVSVSFNASERIEAMSVREGDRVRKGDTLARLNTATLRLAIAKSQAQIKKQQAVVNRLHNGSRPEEIEEAAASLNSLEAENENAARYSQRMEELYASSAISKQELDNAQAKARSAAAEVSRAQAAYRLSQIGPRYEDIAEAEAQLHSLQAELKTQEYNLRQGTLTAPQDGVIRSRLLEPGDMATPQKPVYLLATDQQKWIRAYVPEKRLGQLKPGQKAQIYIDSRPDQPLTGQIGFIADVAEFTPKTVQTEELRTALVYEVRIFVQDGDNVLRMGMPATVKLQLS